MDRTAEHLVGKTNELDVLRGDQQDARIQDAQVQEATVAQHSARHEPVLLIVRQQPLQTTGERFESPAV